jgi:hypothetical protein
MQLTKLLIIVTGVFIFLACIQVRTVNEKSTRDVQNIRNTAGNKAMRRCLTPFEPLIIDSHRQLYEMSCIPSSVEMVLKLLGRAPDSYYDLQTKWKDKADGSFIDFHEKTIQGVIFYQQFTMPRNDNFPLAKLFDTIHNELTEGRFVIVGLASGEDFHNWVIYDEDLNGEFLAVSKSAKETIYELNVKKVISKMNGTDIGTYRIKTPTNK